MGDHYQCGNRIETLEKEIERLRTELDRIKADTGEWDQSAEIERLRESLDAEKQRPNAPSAWAQMKLERDLARDEIERLRAERDDAREWHDDHCAMGCEPPWSKRALRGEGEK